MQRLRTALAGVGGFGAVHLDMLDALAKEGLVEIVAFAEPHERPESFERLDAMGARRYGDYMAMVYEEPELDLVCIAAPVPYHYAMARAAFERGLHVYLENPPVLRIQSLRELVNVQESHGCFCAVGFQDIARSCVATLKRRLCEGAIGPIRAIHAEARWQRTLAYYGRSPWAGKLHLGEDWVLDGPMNNSCAHALNLCAHLAGPDLHEFAVPLRVQGELYRSAPIDGEDTNCLRAWMDTGVEVCVHLTQAAANPSPRSWTIIGEDGVACYDEKAGVDLPGEHIDIDEQEHANLALLRRLVEVIIESDEPLLMPLAESEGFVLMANGAYESAGRIRDIPEQYTRRIDVGDSQAVVVEGIEDVIEKASTEGKLFSECGAPWAIATEPFALEGYERFPQRWTA